MTKIIITIIIVLASLLIISALIIILSIKKAVKTWHENQKYQLDQVDDLKLSAIIKLNKIVRYYNKDYEYLLEFQKIENFEKIKLYALEKDIVSFEVNQIYQVTHDGVVVFSYQLKK